MDKSSLYCIVCIVLRVYQVVCDDASVEKDLRNSIFEGYDKDVKPNNVTVMLSIEVQSFDFLDESHELVSAHVWLTKEWTDSRLQWDNANYGNIETLVVGPDQIWVPDIELFNGISTTETLHYRSVFMHNTGDIFYTRSLHHSFICKMNLLYFPYDKQQCTLKYGSWAFLANHMNLTVRNPDPSLGYIKKGFSEDLILKEAKGTINYRTYPCCPGQQGVDVEYSFYLERYSRAYTAKLVIPSVLAGVLILATFLVPNGTCERITLCGFLFLVFVLLLIYLQTLVPVSGDTIIGDYIAFAIFVNFFATIIAVVSYNITACLKSRPGGGMIDTEGEDHMTKLPMGMNTKWLKYLDIGSFVLFTFVFIIGMAVILGRRG